MKHFIIEATMREPGPITGEVFYKASKGHFEFLDRGFREGRLLACGPKASGDGGVIIIKGSSRAEIEEYMKGDPFKIMDVQEYRLIEFKPYDCQDTVRKWFE